VVNEAIACDLILPYWQPHDSTGSYSIEAEDVVGFPNIDFQDDWTPFHNFAWAEHITSEPDRFGFVEMFGDSAAVAVMILLRERYFPRLWPRLAPNHVPHNAVMDASVAGAAA
jgi:hypothetical protein